MKKILSLIALLMPMSSFAIGLIYDFEWLEPNNKVEVVVGEPYQLKFNCSDNSLPFTNDYADYWGHYDFDGGQHMVATPTGYSIDEKGVITGLIPGSYAIKFTGYIQPKSGVDKMLMIKVVSERSEVEPNNSFETANDVYTKIRFGLYNTSDIDFFKFTNNNLKFGDYVTFKIHYYGARETPFGYKWSTFSGTNNVGGGSLGSQDQECRALVTSGNTVYLEVYYDQSRSQYFNYGEEFVVEMYINGELVLPENNNEDNNENNNNESDEQTYIDLCLPSGLLWAKCNLGASSENETGDYYAWGETTPNKSVYNESTYIVDWNTMPFNISATQYDPAYLKLGEGYRMPTKYDFDELISNCTWEYKEAEHGYRVTGRNGNSILLPFVGGKEDNSYVGYYPGSYYGQGFYMSGTKSESYNLYNWYLYMDDDPFFGMYMYNAHRGQTIRPVSTKTTAIKSIVASKGVVNVYSVYGQLEKSNVKEESIKDLPKGIHIINGKKVMIK